jgi:hypothetical protein
MENESFSLSFESRDLSIYVFNSEFASEMKIKKIIDNNLKCGLKTCIMANDQDLARRFFMDVLKFPELSNRDRKLLEINRHVYRSDDADMLIYPDVFKIDENSVKQAKRLCSKFRTVLFCPREQYDKAKKLKQNPVRSLIETVIELTGSRLRF